MCRTEERERSNSETERPVSLSMPMISMEGVTVDK